MSSHIGIVKDEEGGVDAERLAHRHEVMLHRVLQYSPYEAQIRLNLALPFLQQGRAYEAWRVKVTDPLQVNAVPYFDRSYFCPSLPRVRWPAAADASKVTLPPWPFIPKSKGGR